MIKIKVIDPKKPDQLQLVDLKPETKPNQECFIGRFLNCDLFLDSAEVSRLHGKVFQKHGNYYFADLGSRGGSRINGESTLINQDYLLHPGDTIQIGRFILMISQIRSEEDKTLIESQKNLQEIVVTQPNERVISTVPPVSPLEDMPVAMVESSGLQRSVKELTVRCIGVIDETHDVKTFRFVADPPVLFAYKPGQSVVLELEINNELIWHSYSISSSPSRPHTLEITVKRFPSVPGSEVEEQQALVSNWLHKNVTTGSILKLNEPSGNFTCFANPKQKLLLISAGSGITPMMSMSRWLCDTGASCDIVLFHCARTPRDIIFRQELEMMSARYPNFHLAISTTRREPGQSWFGLTGRLDAAMLQVIAPDFRDRTVYVCGPHDFMECVNQMLKSLDFPMQNYYEERFETPRKKSTAVSEQQAVAGSPALGLKQTVVTVPTETFWESRGGNNTGKGTPTVIQTSTLPETTSSSQNAVVFLKSGKEVKSDGEQPILNLAEQEGVKILSSCRSGICGRCKKRKLQGEVWTEGEPKALDESQCQEGYILTCISYPIGLVLIDA
ncbi:FHA domain-containing protein [Scytonema sp. UIC 10036]|uniref:FHA domain-containing protein n=1 Tax=Scytonema sp. UIC 10036 TaxID=2304196 RepID=UPI0012DA6DDA|nr:FHA domain-containing protein [Scytonema sp. UIC 10036]MUG95307.1 FHA domain-containing protein [Scytonema sp. UIC 10036]